MGGTGYPARYLHRTPDRPMTSSIQLRGGLYPFSLNEMKAHLNISTFSMGGTSREIRRETERLQKRQSRQQLHKPFTNGF